MKNRLYPNRPDFFTSRGYSVFFTFTLSLISLKAVLVSPLSLVLSPQSFLEPLFYACDVYFVARIPKNNLTQKRRYANYVAKKFIVSATQNKHRMFFNLKFAGIKCSLVGKTISNY